MTDLLNLSHAQLAMMRDKVKPGSKEDQALAPYEHGAFAREWTTENPLLAAPSLAVATPLYYLAKQKPILSAAQSLGLVGEGATPASFDQLKQSYSGIGQGLLNGLVRAFNTRNEPS